MRETYSDYDLSAFPMDLWDESSDKRNLMIGAGAGALAGAIYPMEYLGYSRPKTAIAGAVAGLVLALIVNSYGN